MKGVKWMKTMKAGAGTSVSGILCVGFSMRRRYAPYPEETR
jgi:hypothetical protein